MTNLSVIRPATLASAIVLSKLALGGCDSTTEPLEPSSSTAAGETNDAASTTTDNAQSSSSGLASGGAGGTIATGAGGAATSAASTGGAGGGGKTCTDKEPPNNTEEKAQMLPTISDCDTKANTSGVIFGTDVDWYYYEGNDKLGCIADPSRTLTPTDKGLRLCKFVSCHKGKTTFTCPQGTDPNKSPSGLDGCCASMGFAIKDIDCKGTTSDDAKIYLRFDKPKSNGLECIPYQLDYHY
jgi:hypothetical protein